MIKRIAGCSAALLLVGCVGHPPIYDRTMDPLPVTSAQIAGLAHPGQAFIVDGYVHAGVIVTPGRNWFFGQTHGFGAGNDSATSMMRASEQFGGITHSGYATDRRSGRSSHEREALASLYEAGGTAPGGAYRPSSMVPSGGALDSQRIIALLRALDPSRVNPLHQERIVAKTIPVPLFDFNKSVLKPEFLPALREFAAQLKQFEPSGLLHVQGYTDSIGKMPPNQKLSIERARSVYRVLETEGVDTRALIVTGHPLCCYVNDNSSAAGRAQNRRVEMRPGGLYAASDAQPESVALMIASVLKTIKGKPFAPVRVIGAADTPERSNALRTEISAVLQSAEVGLRNVVQGDLAYSASPRIVIEIME